MGTDDPRHTRHAAGSITQPGGLCRPISDAQLLDAMLAYPILIDCPIVVTQLERAVPSSKRPKLAVSSVALQKGRLIQPSPQDDPK